MFDQDSALSHRACKMLSFWITRRSISCFHVADTISIFISKPDYLDSCLMCTYLVQLSLMYQSTQTLHAAATANDGCHDNAPVGGHLMPGLHFHISAGRRQLILTSIARCCARNVDWIFLQLTLTRMHVNWHPVTYNGIPISADNNLGLLYSCTTHKLSFMQFITDKMYKTLVYTLVNGNI